MIMMFIKRIIPYVYLKFKIYFKKELVIINNKLAQTIGFVNINFFGHIYNIYKHRSKKTCR